MTTEAPYNDDDLLRAVALGNETAFARLVDRHKNNIYTSALRITGSRVVAEDILQDVFMKLWLRRYTLPGLDNFRGYLYTLAQNAIFDALRKTAKQKRNTTIIDPDDPALITTEGENTLLEREYAALLHRAVDSLPPKQKQTYILVKQEGLKRGEVADRLRVSSETVKFNLDEAVRKVRVYCLPHVKGIIFLLPLLKKYF